MALGPQVESEAEIVGRHERADAFAGKHLAATLVTPKGQLAAGDVDEVIAPGESGEFGVLPGHITFLSSLRPGVLVLRSGTHRDIFAVDVGFLEVGPTGAVHVLVSRAQAAPEIDAGAAETELGQLTEQLARGGLEGAELAVARASLAWAQARVDASRRDRAH